jgi:hypothetical protein
MARAARTHMRVVRRGFAVGGCTVVVSGGGGPNKPETEPLRLGFGCAVSNGGGGG